MTAIRNALVIGAGIGGLTAATALRRQGIAIDVVELAPTMSVYGVGIIQPNNTLRALDRLGLAKACVEAGAPFPGWQLHDGNGTLLMQVETSRDAAPDFPPNNGITRPAFHRILTDAAADSGANLRFGVTTESVEDGPDGVAVRFTTGDTGRYDLVIACDGLNSRMRHQLFGEGHRPVLNGQGVWRYNLPRPTEMEWGQVFEGPSSKVGLVPLSPSLMYMFVVTAEPDNPRFAGPSLAAEMRKRVDGIPGRIAELAPLIVDPDEVVYRPFETVLLPPPWMKGNIVLIGDAAHSTTAHLGQGAAMAIEDAVLLAELMAWDEPVAGLLEQFMRRRFQRVKTVCDASLQLGRWELENWAGKPSPDANPGALIHSTTEALMAPY